MRQILYVSLSSAPGTADLVGILHQSRHNNALDGITGLLWSDGRRFMQAIEGPRSSVATTFERIRADPRHHSVVVLEDSKIDARAFGSWTMTHRRSSGLPDPSDAHMARVLDNASEVIRRQFFSLIAPGALAA